MTELERLLATPPDDGDNLVRARERFLRRAADEGLVDVAYARVPSPFGEMTVAATRRGVVRVAFPERPIEELADELADRVSPRVLEAPARLDDVRRQLDEYFSGRRKDFELPLDWALEGSGFRKRVLEATARIPYGQALTYRDVATKAGNPLAVRAAGNAVGYNRLAIIVPCHRVLRTGGALGGYGGGVDRKRYLLELEGVLSA